MSVVQTALAAGLATIRQMLGVTVVYSDGVHSPFTIKNAGVGITEYELDDGSGIVETWTARDYLIPANAIVPGGVPTLPAKGHTITETINGIPKTFSVLGPPGKQVFEFSDPGQTTLRIHTQQIA